MKELANTTAIPRDGLKTKRCPAERSLEGLGVDVQDQDTLTDLVTAPDVVGVTVLVGCGEVKGLLDGRAPPCSDVDDTSETRAVDTIVYGIEAGKEKVYTDTWDVAVTTSLEVVDDGDARMGDVLLELTASDVTTDEVSRCE